LGYARGVLMHQVSQIKIDLMFFSAPNPPCNLITGMQANTR